MMAKNGGLGMTDDQVRAFITRQGRTFFVLDRQSLTLFAFADTCQATNCSSMGSSQTRQSGEGTA